MPASEVFANQPTTTLAGPQGTATTTWTVASSLTFPAASTGVSQFHIADTATAASSELILVTNVSGSTWTVTRGAESTTPQSHAAGATITQVVTAGWLNTVSTGGLSLPVTVAEGGSGQTALTSYGVLAGGTSSTSPVQQVSGLGTSGQFLTSNGASAMPTWQSGTASSTANALADLSGSVNVSLATAPTTGQVLTATSGTTATWQTAATSTANALADLSGSVNVSLATAPTTGQVLTATSGTTATWQPGTASSTANYLADLSGSVNVSNASAPTTGQALVATSSTTATWQGVSGGTAGTLTRQLWTVPSPGATYTAATWELTSVSTASGSGTVFLPLTSAAPSGTENAVKQIIQGAGNTLTIETQSPDVLNYTGSGSTTATLTVSGEAVLAQSNGSGIWTIFADDLPVAQVVQLGADLGGTATAPLVQSTHLTVSTNTAATGTAVTLNATSTRVFNVTQSGAATFAFTSSGLTAATAYGFELYLNPGTFATTWPGSVNWVLGTTPTLVQSTTNILTFETVNQGTTWYGAMVQQAPTLPVPVASGGTGVVALTANQVLLGGVTSTSPVQTVAGTTSGYVLTSNGATSAPTWMPGGGSSNANPAGFAPSDPTSTTSAALVMMGLGSTCAYTPSGSGIVLANVTGVFQQASANACAIGARWGTGTPPSNGAAVTGTRWGPGEDYTGLKPTGSTNQNGFGFTGVIALTAATGYWFDLAASTSVTAATLSIKAVSMTFAELGS